MVKNDPVVWQRWFCREAGIKGNPGVGHIQFAGPEGRPVVGFVEQDPSIDDEGGRVVLLPAVRGVKSGALNDGFADGEFQYSTGAAPAVVG